MSSFRVKLIPGLLALPIACFGWGREGHRMIAQLAVSQLNAHAKSEIAKLLEPGERLDTIASWADDVRPQRRESGPWHYINLPIDVKAGADWTKYCPTEGCVLRKTNELIAYLKSNAGSRTERAEALKFLVHFMGDLHQPLHAGDNHDRGGNDLKVVLNGQPSNLHSAWDTALVVALESREPEFAKNPGRQLSWWTRCRMRRGDVPKWTWESHDRSRDVAYAKIPPERPAALADAYVNAATPTVRQQIQRGGIRLGKALNGIWP